MTLRCKATTDKKHRCTRKAMIYGYCTLHYIQHTYKGVAQT